MTPRPSKNESPRTMPAAAVEPVAESCRPQCGCGPPALARRAFLQVGGLGLSAIAAGGWSKSAWAGPPEGSEVIPADKQRDPAWYQALRERGTPTSHRGDALKFIGMPVGGLFAGMVYLSGDGRLWLWEIFNRQLNGAVQQTVAYADRQLSPQDGANYVQPTEPFSPFHLGIELSWKGAQGLETRPLSRDGFGEVVFRGEYPIGVVNYADAACPVTVQLEAFSPFIPLNTNDSSLPATILSYQLVNHTAEPLELWISGTVQNPVCLHSRGRALARLRNRVVRDGVLTSLLATAEPLPASDEPPRPDLVFDEFERAEYAPWQVEGTAFGTGPIRMAEMPEYQGQVGGQGARVVNSHNVRQGEDVGGGDRHRGVLISPEFTIERRFIRFLIGGGSHPQETCVNLRIGNRVVHSVTGHNDNRMRREAFDVRELEGLTARLEIVDAREGGWGNIGADAFVFTDRPLDETPLADLADFGSLALSILGPADSVTARPMQGESAHVTDEEATAELGQDLRGYVARRLVLAPHEPTTVSLIVSWHFPNLQLPTLGRVGHHYAARFASALEVARYMAANWERLTQDTRLWRDTWYDSSLPYWFLDRTMANTTTLATTTCLRFTDGRFWAWEGTGCCPGTCTHVWHYAQALGRLFPEVERDLRERVDYGLAFHADSGLIDYRGEFHRDEAHDGQAGSILRAYREHQMSASVDFLRRNWPQIRRSLEYLIAKDGNDDGMIEGAQPNTLDAAWFGRIPFLASLYLAALQAGAAMALEVDDRDFADHCRRIADRGAARMMELFNGEYFQQQEDPAHAEAIGVGTGCYIDQVFGQSWAFQVGLGRLWDAEATRSALHALWKYNFVPDVGPFRQRFPRGRWYAVAGEAGLVMCTWPKGGKRADWEKHWQYMYFNECMSGFEWQVAAHFLWEGLVDEGLAVARAIHDRYDAVRRNPYNEVECSDHYARAMASYGAYLAACGFRYHGPRGQLGLAPAWNPENFRAAFTVAEGWGTWAQHWDDGLLTVRIDLKHGQLRLRQLLLELPPAAEGRLVKQVLWNGQPRTGAVQEGRRITISCEPEFTLRAATTATVEVSLAGLVKDNRP